MSVTREDKQRFFAQLDGLDDNTDSESDHDLQKLLRKTIKRRRLRCDAASKNVEKDTSQTEEVLPVDPTDFRHVSTDLPAESVRPAPTRRSTRQIKRTRSEPNPSSRSDKLATPASHVGLFSGLSFYFIPNDDVNKIRKLRIQSAIAQGATWVRNLSAATTHVIVDSEIGVAAVARTLGDKCDCSKVAVVKDTWLIESLSHMDVRDPKQGRFQLKGSIAITATTDVPTKGAVSKLVTTPVAQQGNRMDQQAAGAEVPLDELSQIVQDMQNAEYLPFDEDLDLDKFVSYSSGDERDDVNHHQSTKPAPVPQENRGFACMKSHTGRSDNPNNRTIEVLQQMATHYDRTGDHWRTTGYRKAIGALRKQETLVSTKQQAAAIWGIGNRLADKIEEIVTTDRLQRLEWVLADPDDKVLQLFMGIYDVGFSQAKLWMSQGYRTLSDLKQNVKLSPNQQVGVDHYHDFQQRIPRSEVERHGAIVQKALKRTNRELEGIIGGSYRRGMPDSGDVDIMITHPTADIELLRKWVFEEVVPYLSKIDFIKCTLATSRSVKKSQRSPAKGETISSKSKTPTELRFPNDTSSGTKFLGASALTRLSPWRRLDLLLVPASSLGANLIYFTGNDIFNRSMRLLASRKGMRLNQYGLYKNVIRGPNRVKETDGELVEGRSEKRIFEILEVPWRRPEERRC